jgi:uncharacterized protein YkwD
MTAREAAVPAANVYRMAWLAAIIVALCVMAAPAGATAPDNLQALRQRALELVNQARAAHGLSRLEPGSNLDEAAQSHAQDMLRHGYFSHTSPYGGTVQDRYVAAGGSRSELVAENIARCEGCTATAARIERLQEGWMNSPEHRENILREGLSRFGFGIATNAQGSLYAVQTFAGPGTPRGAGRNAEQSAALSRKEIAAGATDLINEARRRANVGDLRASPALDEAAHTLLPEPNAEAAALDTGGDLFEAVPTGERGRWRSLYAVSAICGGCGAHPTSADIHFFRDQWLDNPQYKQRLLGPDATAMGFAMQADGSGRKSAVLVLGAAR